MAAGENDGRDMNRDPITNEPGAHPVGTGIGSAGGAMTGAAVGAMAGPIGAAIGGIAGAVLGGLAGKAAGEAVNPTAEEAFWRENHTKEPYYQQGRTYDDYSPAYRLGVDARTRHDGDWTAVEPRLASEWESNRGNSTLNWADASHATRAAWSRADSQLRGAGSRMGSDSDSSFGSSSASSSGSSSGSSMVGGAGTGGAAAAVGAIQSAGDSSGTRSDVIDVLEDLVECSKDGEYGFRECAEHVKRQDVKAILLQRADDCRRGAQELNELIRSLGGSGEEGGSAMGAIHRGWVSVKSALTTYDDQAVLTECERGEDNAKARYRKALEKNLPENVRQVVQRQYDGVLRNHDQVKMLRNQA